MYARIEDLFTGDLFIEDCYPEIYRVIGHTQAKGYNGPAVRVREVAKITSPDWEFYEEPGPEQVFFGDDLCLVVLK